MRARALWFVLSVLFPPAFALGSQVLIRALERQLSMDLSLAHALAFIGSPFTGLPLLARAVTRHIVPVAIIYLLMMAIGIVWVSLAASRAIFGDVL